MRNHRCRFAARALLALAVAGCARVEKEPVAPFGGRLAEALPYGDVLGFARFRPGDELSRQLGTWAAAQRIALKLSVFGPTLKVLELAVDPERSLVEEDEPLLVLFLDPSVHGAMAAFAWRGDAARFRETARAHGLVLRGESAVELPGCGRMTGPQVLTLVGHGDGSVDEDELRAAPQRVVYHLIERDGFTLLAPARDGSRNLLATIAATGALDEDEIDGCLRFELGALAREVRDESRHFLAMAVENGITSIPGMQGDDELHYERRFDRAAWRLRRTIIEGILETASSIDHLFVRWNGGRIEAYLLTEPDSFLRKVLAAGVNRPMEELVAGVPADANAALAFSIDPARIATVPALLRNARRNPFERQFEIEFAEPVAEDEPASFLDSFGGRGWFALTARSTVEEGTDEQGAAELRARIFAELANEDAATGLLAAIVEALPPVWRDVVKAQSLLTYRVQRVAGGAVEVVGLEPGAALQREVARLAAPEKFPVPWDGPEQAFAVFSFAEEGPLGRVTLSLTRDERGVQLMLTLPDR